MQIALHDVFQQYYEQDPATRAAPIPTAQISLPVSNQFHRNICYAQRYLGHSQVSDSDIRATAAAILSAALKLNVNADATAIQQHNPDIGNSTLRKYVLKRNHSGFARKIVQISLDLSNWQTDTLSPGPVGPGQPVVEEAQPICNSSNDTLHSNSQSLVKRAAGGQQQHSNTTSNSTPLDAGFDDADVMPEETAGIANSLPHPSTGTTPKTVTHGPLHDAEQLLAAAERMLRESCGEDWLLQPFIPDMGSNEYRYSIF